MSIKHYGLDEAEINTLRSLGVSEDAIEEANQKRAKEQLAEEDDRPDGPLLKDLPKSAEDGEDDGGDDELLEDVTPTNPELLAIWNQMKSAFSTSLPPKSDGSWSSKVEDIARPYLTRIENAARNMSRQGKKIGPLGVDIGYIILAKSVSK